MFQFFLDRGVRKPLPSRCQSFHRIRVFSDDVIAPRLSVAVRRHLDRLPHGLSSCLPSAVEVQAHHRNHARHAGAVHRRDDGDLLLGLFADVEAAAVSGAGADCGVVLVRGEGRPGPHAGQRPVLPRLFAERDLLREPRAVDVLLRPGRRKGFRRPCPRRTDDRRNLQHPADTARDRHLLHEGAEPAGRRQGHRAHAVLLADAVRGESRGPGQGGADRR